jgi:Fic family protein
MNDHAGIPVTGRFSYSHTLVRNLGRIESARAVVEVLPLPPDRILMLRQAAQRHSTRHSTRIEGNTLNSREVGIAVAGSDRSPTDMQQEVRNYWRALEWIEDQVDEHRMIGEDYIRELHCIIDVRGVGRRGRKSEYRTGECPVVDSATGRIDYGPPVPADIPALMHDLAAWVNGPAAAVLPGPVRAGLLAHRFVSIHPFPDGNGRTARALATAELWRSGYGMRGFLSLEERYTADLQDYYGNLQMGLPVNYYEGRHDPDHSAWLGYFLRTMAESADELRRSAVELFQPDARPALPWEKLRRVQQQLLTRLVVMASDEPAETLDFTPQQISLWYGVSANTAREWLDNWRLEGFVEAVNPGALRVRTWRLTAAWLEIITGSSA